MNKSGFAIPQILIFTLALVIVAGGYLVFKPEVKNQEILSEQNSISTIADSETSDWQTYRNEEYGIEFKYPSQFAVIGPQSKRFDTGLIFLKYLGQENIKTNGNAIIYVSTETDPAKIDSCLVHEGGGKASANVNLVATSTPSGVWYIDHSSDAGMSQQYNIKNFITVRDDKCFEFSLLVHTSNLGVYEPGTVTEFDATEVNSLFSQIFSTFKFISPAAFVPAKITVLSPNGEGAVRVGDVYRIKWSSTGLDPNLSVILDLVQPTNTAAGGWGVNTISRIGLENLAKGYYDWTVPNIAAKGYNNYKIKIQLANGDDVGDLSDGEFEIKCLICDPEGY